MHKCIKDTTISHKDLYGRNRRSFSDVNSQLAEKDKALNTRINYSISWLENGLAPI